MTGALDCAQVRARGSLYLDGRLRAESRQRVQEHLRQCPTCLAEYRMLCQLSRATLDLPARQVVADLAQCVRERVTARREKTLSALGTPRRRWLAAAAAAVVLFGAWGLGYAMGSRGAAAGETDGLPGAPGTLVSTGIRPGGGPSGPGQSGRGQGAPSASTAATRGTREAGPAGPGTGQRRVFAVRIPRDRTMDEPHFVLAARGVLRDLALIGNVPPRGRRPLVAAQLTYFDLDKEAERLARNSAQPATRTMAGFITEFGGAVCGTGDVDWTHWQRQAQARGLFEGPPPTRPKLRPRRAETDRERVAAVADRCGRELTDRDRAALAELLVLKDGYVQGQAEASIRYADRLNDPSRTVDHVFQLPATFVAVETLTDAGLERDAENVFVKLRARIHVGTGDQHTRIMVFRSTSGDGDDGMREQLERFWREIGTLERRRSR